MKRLKFFTIILAEFLAFIFPIFGGQVMAGASLVTLEPIPEGVTVDVTAEGENDDTNVTILGGGEKQIRTLHQGSLGAGNYKFVWDGKDDAGVQLPPGPYAVEVREKGTPIYREGFFLERDPISK